MEKALVLVSGGLDSSVLLAKISKDYGSNRTMALCIFYGQKHAKELEYAKYQTSKWSDFPLMQIDLSNIFVDMESPLIRNNEDAEDGEYEGGQINPWYVPYRNGIFLSVAAGVAMDRECDTLYYGAHSNDGGAAYPDCSRAFAECQAAAIRLGTGRKVFMSTPFLDIKKVDIVSIGIRLGVEFDKTWSCYKGCDEPCGVCGTCIDRKNAFLENGVKEK